MEKLKGGNDFLVPYRYCSITRNLQMLGAFGYLSRVKGKKQFEKYIPEAAHTLENNLSSLSKDTGFPVRIKDMAAALLKSIKLNL